MWCGSMYMYWQVEVAAAIGRYLMRRGVRGAGRGRRLRRQTAGLRLGG